MEYFAEFLLFLAKTVTIVGGLVMLVALISAIGQKTKKLHKGHLEVTKLNEHFDHLKNDLKHVLLDKDELKSIEKEEKKQAKKDKKKKDKNEVKESKPRLFVLDFNGDIKASAVKSLREEITAVLALARDKDEVVVRLESGGGMVHSYGLASSQLKRITDKGINLTVTVDKVAASGGYMMACTADKIVAAPFAILGSVGVMAQLPNFHRLLKKNDIDVELHTAGEYKRTLTVFGENNEKGREKFKKDMEDTHVLFKDFVKGERDQIDIEEIATGEIWYGKKALEMKLVDELKTSDEYIYQNVENSDLIHVSYVVKKGVANKLGLAAESAIEETLVKWWGRLAFSRFFS